MTPLGSSTAILVSDILPALIHVLFFKKALSTAWIVTDWIIVAVTAVLMVILPIQFRLSIHSYSIQPFH